MLASPGRILAEELLTPQGARTNEARFYSGSMIFLLSHPIAEEPGIIRQVRALFDPTITKIEKAAKTRNTMTRFIVRIATSSGLRELKFIKNDHS